jgi:hypothetical protein
MTRRPLARRILGLIAIYALVLQSLLAPVAMAVAAAGGTIVCASQEGDPALPDHGNACLSCAACQQAADVPIGAGVELAWRAENIGGVAPSYVLALPARHQPQSARAPPAG